MHMTESSSKSPNNTLDLKTAFVMVVVPTYNEAQNLPELAKRLFALNIPNLGLIIVDDNSPDGTGQVAEDLSKEYGGRLRVIHRSGKLGIATAYEEAFELALQNGADVIIQMDADLSHNPEYILAFIEKLKAADVVVGSRYVKGGGFDPSWEWHRKLLSTLGNLYIRVVTGVKVRDTTSGFKAYRRSVLEDIKLKNFKCKGFAFQAEMAYICLKRNYRVVEHPIIFMGRTTGKSKMSLYIIFEALWKLLPLRFKR